MFIVLKKKKLFFLFFFVFCVLGLVVLLCSGSLNNYKAVNNYTSEKSESDDLLPGEAVVVSNQDDELVLARNNREYSRSKTAQMLRDVINDKNTTSDARKKAENYILKLAEKIDKELKIENLLLTKGYKDCVVFIEDDGSTILTIRSEKLDVKDVARITDIIYGITENNIIKIVEVG